MSNISIIGTGNMASTIGTLAMAGGNTVEVIGRDQAKAADLAKALGDRATTREFGAVPAGDIVVVALLYANVAPVVAEFVESLNLRSLDVGGLTMAHWLEGAGLVVMGLSRHGVGNFGFDIKVDDQPRP